MVYVAIGLATAILTVAVGLFIYAVDHAVKQVPTQMDMFGRKPSTDIKDKDEQGHGPKDEAND